MISKKSTHNVTRLIEKPFYLFMSQPAWKLMPRDSRGKELIKTGKLAARNGNTVYKYSLGT